MPTLRSRTSSKSPSQLTRYLRGVLGTTCTLVFGTLILFWAVKGTKPSGSAVFPIFYAVLVFTALLLLAVEIVSRRGTRKLGDREAPAIACKGLAREIKDWMLTRDSNDPGAQHQLGLSGAQEKRQDEKERAYREQTGNEFHYRFGSRTRRLFEKLSEQGFIERSVVAEIFRLDKVNPGDIHRVAHILESVSAEL